LGLEEGDRLPGFYSIGRSNAKHWRYAGPGAWNDPDYILIGHIGTPPAAGFGEPQRTSLTPNEQYSYMSMWSLMAAPLFFSGDMEQLDEFTLNVLCNNEIIEVNQDRLGRQATPVRMDEREIVMSKPMADGSLAVGLFNLDESPKSLTVTWQQLGLQQPQRVRDLWRQRDIGKFTDDFKSEVPQHGVKMVRLWPAK
jgi:alpha-galactosidase